MSTGRVYHCPVCKCLTARLIRYRGKVLRLTCTACDYALELPRVDFAQVEIRRPQYA